VYEASTEQQRGGGQIAYWLLQSNLEYSNSNYASTSVLNNIRLRMESEDLFDKRNQGDLLDSSS